MERLSALLGHLVQFFYTALDRIVLNGYIGQLQRPENLVHFFHAVAGVACIEPDVLTRRTKEYRAWVEGYAADRDIPLLAAPKGAQKEGLVQPYYRRLEGREGVACILTSMEQNGTFISYKPRYPTDNGDYRKIGKCRKQFLHYYFYVFDRFMGPMSLRFATYLPFNVTCYMNGHSFLAQELTRQGIKFAQEDNAIVDVSDAAALQAAADRITPALLRRRCQRWIDELGPRFTAPEQGAMDLKYRLSMAQIELATDVLFHRSVPIQEMFRRSAEIGVLLGGARHTGHLFGRQVTRRYPGKLQTVLERMDEGHPVLRCYYHTSYVKQYQKNGRLLRTETCINDTRHLGMGRRLDNLPALVERMKGTNDRFLDVQAELLDSTVDTGQLIAITQPTVQGSRRIPGIKLHDDRVIRLLDTLLHPGTFVAHWTTRELHARILARHRLPEPPSLSQLRYDLSKLRAKGLVERIGRTRRYALTPLGVRLGVLLVKIRTILLGPLLTLAQTDRPRRSATHLSQVETAFRQVDRSLDQLLVALGLKVA